MLIVSELDALETACRLVPLTENTYIATDLVSTLLDTVIDYQQHTTTVRNAIAHYNTKCWDAVSTLNDLDELFARYPNDKEGNTALASISGATTSGPAPNSSEVSSHSYRAGTSRPSMTFEPGRLQVRSRTSRAR